MDYAARRDPNWVAASAASVLAAIITAGVFAIALPLNTRRVRVFFVAIAVPPVAMSVLAGVSYHRHRGKWAGHLAVIVHWLFFVLFGLAGGLLFFPGGVMQTIAWLYGKGARRARNGGGPTSVVPTR